MCVTWDTTQREDEPLAGAERSRIWLKWVFPPVDRPVALDHGLVVGRDESCEIRLEGNGVSRRHLQIHRQGPIFALKDLESTNGTFLNGKRIQHAAVVPGAVLRVGDHVAVFVESVAPPSAFAELASGIWGGHELQLSLSAARCAATSDIPILLIGATGTGKERVARAIHELSGREGPFHALNCAALPKDLAEAELFGYRKGAFTGADRASSGHFRAADGGTLFLDEIGELPACIQAKLLRVLEEHAVMGLGETSASPINVRIIAAAQSPLDDATSEKRFREDLLARLAGLIVTLPTLRERRGDVAALFMHFIERYSGPRRPQIEARLIEALCVYGWPANVRELEQVARQLLAVHGSKDIIKREALPKQLLAQLPSVAETVPAPSAGSSERRDHDLQRLAIALQQSAGNVAAAAALLGFSRHRAYRLLGGMTPNALMEEQLRANGQASKGDA